jgi:hypothetical protein
MHVCRDWRSPGRRERSQAVQLAFLARERTPRLGRFATRARLELSLKQHSFNPTASFIFVFLNSFHYLFKQKKNCKFEIKDLFSNQMGRH